MKKVDWNITAQGTTCNGSGRWASPDPSGLIDGPNLFLYVNARPIIALDPSGREEKQLWLMEQKGTQINPIATRVDRGIRQLQRAALRVLDAWFGPGRGADWAHPEGKSFVTQPANTSEPLTPSPRSDNTSKQNASKVAGNQSAASGGFKRVWDGNHSVDESWPKGKQIKQPPVDPWVKEIAPLAKNLNNLPTGPVQGTSGAKPPAIVTPPWTQLELPLEQSSAKPIGEPSIPRIQRGGIEPIPAGPRGVFRWSPSGAYGRWGAPRRKNCRSIRG